MNKGNKQFELAYCGLLCSECVMYKKGVCQGCHSFRSLCKNCSVKKCNQEHGYETCAECEEFENLRDCRKLNNWMTKIVGFVFGTDRIGNLERIRDIGVEQFENQSNNRNRRNR